MIRPWHPFTKESQRPVAPGEPTEYRIEIYPTSAIIKAGDRLRLTIGTANTFSDAPDLPTLGQELGGASILQIGADPRLERSQPLLLELEHELAHTGLACEAGERPPAPEREPVA